MRTQADVVVIGGGIVGCAIAWHLAERGVTDVVLLERAELTAGSTWHAAGGFHSLNGASSMAALQGYTLGLYDRLQAEEEGLGLHRTGAIYLAGDDAWAEWLVVEQARALTAGVLLHDLPRDELLARAPIVDASRVVHALFDPLDGHLDPAGTTRAFAAGARRRGATIERHRPVTGLSRRGAAWDVETAAGTIRARHVVIAAGLWAREVAALAGVTLPVLPMEHQYLLTDPIPEVEATPDLPTIADFLSGSYMRREGRGLLYGTYEQGPWHWALDGTPRDFGMDLLPPDLDRVAPNLEAAAERIPCLARTGIRRVVNGPLVVTPDGNPVVGPVAPGLWVAAGVLAGFSQCGGIGLALANWIGDGEPGMDVWAMDVARFGHATPGYVRAKTREVYERRYALTKPNEHLPAARPLRVTPLYDRLRAAGAVWGAQSGWEYPTHFAPPGTAPERPSWSRSDAFAHVRAECLAVRDAAGVFETSPYAKFMVEGAGALPWLQAMTCNALPARDGRVGLMPGVSASGRLAGDLTVTRLGPDRALLIGSPQAEFLYARMLGEPPEGVSVTNLTEAWGGLAVSGPEAPAILADLGLDLPLFGAAFVDVGVARALALRISFTGEAGAEVYAPAAVLRHVHDALLEAGTPRGLRPYGVSALNALRIEKLYPSFGSEIGADVDPFEADLRRYVKAPHASAALLRRGEDVRQRLAGLVIDAGDADPVGSEPVLAEGAVVGRLSSAAFGHRVGRAVALAFLPVAHAVEGRALQVRVLGRDHPAVVTLRAPYDPEGLRLRAPLALAAE